MKKENGTRNCVVFPKYLFSFISISVSTCSSRINNPLFKAKNNFFKNYFFSSVVIPWNKLSQNMSNSESRNMHKKHLLKFIHRSRFLMFDWNNPTGVTLLSARPPFMNIIGKIDRNILT